MDDNEIEKCVRIIIHSLVGCVRIRGTNAKLSNWSASMIAWGERERKERRGGCVRIGFSECEEGNRRMCIKEFAET